ncbi:MAG TPA: hypothetical protein VLA90_06625, partial [Actinomycetota bacterium]|nr:hypothetical protein [Actinomycetota bacterium]
MTALAVAAIGGAGVASAVTICTFNPATGTINATIDPGESAGLAVNSASGFPDGEAPPGAILFDAN